MSRKNIQNENRIFAPENATPDPNFKKELWDKCEAAYSGRNAGTKSKRSFSLLNFFSLDFMNRTQRIAFFSVFAIFLLSGVVLITFDFIGKTKTSTFSQADTSRILTEISRNNKNLNSRNNLLDSSYRAWTSNQLSSNNSMMAGVTDEAATQKVATDMMILPWYSDPDTLIYSKTSTKVGPMYASCKYIVVDDYYPEDLSAEREIESYSYFRSGEGDSQNTYLTKTITRDQNGVIRDYYLSDGEYNYYYKGGNFAIKQKSAEYGFPVLYETQSVVPQTTTSDPSIPEPEIDYGDTVQSSDSSSGVESSSGTDAVSETNSSTEKEIAPISPIAPEDPINIFGDDAKIVKTEEIDGKKYYVIDQNTYGYCDSLSVKEQTLSRVKSISGNVTADDSVTSISLDVPFVIRYWFAVDDYKILKSETYKTSVMNANLVVSERFKESEEKGSFEKFANIFTFSEIDHVVSIGQIEYTAESVLLDNLIKTKTFAYLTPKSFNGNLNDVYLPDNPVDPLIEQLKKREYYPNSSLGELMFNRAITDFSNGLSSSYKPYGESFLSYNYESKMGTNNAIYWNLRVNIYENSVTEDKMLENVYIDQNSVEKSSISLSVDGVNGAQKLTGQLYTIEYTSQSVPGYAGSDAGVSVEMIDKTAPDYVESKSLNQFLIFEYSGNKYLVQFYSSDDSVKISQNIGFSALEVSTDASRNSFKSIVNNFIDDNANWVGVLDGARM